MFLVFGVLAAVWSAQRTGIGQVVDASMVDGSASMMAMTHSLINAGLWTEKRGVNLLDTGAPSTRFTKPKMVVIWRSGPLSQSSIWNFSQVSDSLKRVSRLSGIKKSGPR